MPRNLATCNRDGDVHSRNYPDLLFPGPDSHSHFPSLGCFHFCFFFLLFFFFCPRFVSDSYWGRFDTVIRFGVVYCVGAAILASTALVSIRVSFTIRIQSSQHHNGCHHQNERFQDHQHSQQH